MNRIITLIVLFFLAFQVFGQNYKYVNAETLNVRENAGKQYNIVGKVKSEDKVTVVSESGKWTQIETENGLKGYVATKFLSSSIDNPKESKGSDKKGSSWIGVLVILGIIGYGVFKVINFFSDFNAGSSSSSSSQRESPTQKQSINNPSRKSAVFRFRIKGNGSAGGFKFADGMNVEVAVTGLGASGSPFNSIVEDLFVKEIARKYNVEPRCHSGIKMLFKRDSLDVEVM